MFKIEFSRILFFHETADIKASKSYIASKKKQKCIKITRITFRSNDVWISPEEEKNQTIAQKRGLEGL